MGGNQTFLQFVGKRTDNLFNDRNRQVGTINQVFFDIVAVGIFINNRIVGLFNNIGAFIGDENADDIFRAFVNNILRDVFRQIFTLGDRFLFVAALRFDNADQVFFGEVGRIL